MQIKFEHIAQIVSGDITLGDLTFIVGPQASGKSIFLQLFKFLQDAPHIKYNLKSRGFDWEGELDTLQQIFWGEHYTPISKINSRVWQNKREVSWQTLSSSNVERGKREKVFYIPAQRVLCLENGFPRPFGSFQELDPYCLKWFSDSLNTLMQAGLGKGKDNVIFPQENRFKKEIRERIQSTIYGKAALELSQKQFRNRITLNIGNKEGLPFLTWSAGQKEFTPLLLGLYWLMPSGGASKKEEIEYVIIEEPEMGLHPFAIESLMLVFLELVERGYKLIISTHSQTLLNAVWAIKQLQGQPQDSLKYMKALFHIQNTALNRVFSATLEKTIHTYFFQRLQDGVHIKDISNLNDFSNDDAANWGGLSSFSSTAVDVVASIHS
jgi:energy-coupling factor transporter ATP-binding protein EcfA2